MKRFCLVAVFNNFSRETAGDGEIKYGVISKNNFKKIKFVLWIFVRAVAMFILLPYLF